MKAFKYFIISILTLNLWSCAYTSNNTDLKFKEFNQTLEYELDIIQEEYRHKLREIKKTVQINGSYHKNLALISKAESFFNKQKEIHYCMDDSKKNIAKIPRSAGVQNYMSGKKGIRLQKAINKYLEALSEEFPNS